MAHCSYDYSTHYRWEWFNRDQWRHTFREKKRHSSCGFIELIRNYGMLDQPVLDCSCGLGLKTIVMHEAGLSVTGSDGCAEAIRLAGLFAEEEDHSDILYFMSSWADLPRKINQRYAAIFNDALSWVNSEQEMLNSLKGMHDALLPGGILVYMGALPGTNEDQQLLLEEEWQRKTSNGRHWLRMEASDDDTSIKEIVFLDKGEDYIDEHHLYLIQDRMGQRLENWCLRCSLKWRWSRIQPFLEEAGFTSFDAKEFISENGKPFHLVLAVRK